MADVIIERPVGERSTVGDRVMDARRLAEDISHEARVLKSNAQDAIADGVQAARRAIKTVERRVEDSKSSRTRRSTE
jgi:hypothetical protein